MQPCRVVYHVKGLEPQITNISSFLRCDVMGRHNDVINVGNAKFKHIFGRNFISIKDTDF